MKKKTSTKIFFAKIYFDKKSYNEESEHNEKTHKERTNQEEVKKKRKENQLLFRGVFFLNRNKGIEKIFFKKSLKTCFLKIMQGWCRF